MCTNIRRQDLEYLIFSASVRAMLRAHLWCPVVFLGNIHPLFWVKDILVFAPHVWCDFGTTLESYERNLRLSFTPSLVAVFSPLGYLAHLD
jgi:hypothetical protein